MKYVYLIRSKSHPKQSYIGITSDLKKRLTVHNSGGSVPTSKFKPWELISYLANEKRGQHMVDFNLALPRISFLHGYSDIDPDDGTHTQ